MFRRSLTAFALASLALAPSSRTAHAETKSNIPQAAVGFSKLLLRLEGSDEIKMFDSHYEVQLTEVTHRSDLCQIWPTSGLPKLSCFSSSPSSKPAFS